MKTSLPLALLALAIAPPLFAAPIDVDQKPFLSATFKVDKPANNLVHRGVAVAFDGPLSGVIFDTETLRLATAWTGGFINLKGVAFDGGHGANPSPKGTILFGTRGGPGWAHEGSFADPRPIPHGSLPSNWGRYKGLYRHENGTVFVYTVDGTQIMEMPDVEGKDSGRFFTRTLQIAKSAKPLAVLVADVDGANGKVEENGVAILEKGTEVTLAGVVVVPAGTSFALFDKGRLILKLPALTQDTRLKLCVWVGSKPLEKEASAALAKLEGPKDLTPLTKGGKTRWTQAVTTTGKRGDETKAYAVDQVQIPFKNPYNSWMRFGGVDFFKDGRAAISTWSGDVWIVSGLDDKLEKVTWKRRAAGLFQALGLKIVDDQIYVLGRDQITRLVDLNGDGEADFYECINNDWMVTNNFHEFIFDLHTDPQGNFYFIKGGPVRPGGSGWDKITPNHGCIFKVSKDGSKFEVVARGFRAPNGMGVGPHGEITTGDNEGTWTPMCPINWIKPGGFYGVPDFANLNVKPIVRDNPLCWMPKNIDNSGGGQCWIDSAKFGPLSNQLLHTSYGTSTLFLVLKEECAGQMQGGVVKLQGFDSGVSRMRFLKDQNVLWLTGLRGWQTNASKDAGLYRVRYTGKNAYIPSELHADKGTLKITFTEPLDKKSVDADSFGVEQWNYKWTQNYGSPHFKVSNPKQQGKDEVEVDEATLSADGRTVTLKIASLRPVMQMKININVKAADGTPIRQVIHNTLNVVGDQRGEIHVGEYKVLSTKK